MYHLSRLQRKSIILEEASICTVLDVDLLADTTVQAAQQINTSLLTMKFKRLGNIKRRSGRVVPPAQRNQKG